MLSISFLGRQIYTSLMQLTAFSIIIPTRDRAAVLGKTLRALARQTYSRTAFEVLVVDNDPSDAKTKQAVTTFKRQHVGVRLRYYRLEERGTSLARNFGIKQARYSHLIFIDDDILASPDFLAGYHQAWRRFPQARLIGAQVSVVRLDGKPLTPDQQALINHDDAWCLGRIELGPEDRKLERGDCLAASNLSYRRSTKSQPLFNPALGVEYLPGYQFGSEDVELSQRLLLQNETLMYVADPRLKVDNQVSVERFSSHYLNTRFWSHGMELAAIEAILGQRFPDARPVYRGTLWHELTHWPSCLQLIRRFATNKREWIRLLSYLLNGPYVVTTTTQR